VTIAPRGQIFLDYCENDNSEEYFCYHASLYHPPFMLDVFWEEGFEAFDFPEIRFCASLSHFASNDIDLSQDLTVQTGAAFSGLHD